MSDSDKNPIYCQHSKAKRADKSALQLNKISCIYFPADEVEKRALRNKVNLPLSSNMFVSSGDLSTRKDPLFLIPEWSKTLGAQDNNHLVLMG
jgi:hypothetical protein